jgi:aspartate-alanine antiporter
MGSALHTVLGSHPEVALFLALCIGHAIGQIRFGPVQLGGICGTLIAALVIGQVGVEVDAGVKNLFFMLFIFALGYAGGPQFFANLNAKGLRIGLLCGIEVVTVLVLVLLATRLMHLDAGTAAGMMAGAATESAVVGTASDAISKLALPAEEVKRLQANVVTAYSITYIFGLIAIVVATSQVFPLLLRIDLRAEAARLWKEMGGREDDAGVQEAAPEMVGRVYEVTAGAGHSVATVLALLGGEANVEGVRRGGADVPVVPSLVLEAGDQLLVAGRRAAIVRLVSAGAGLGREIADTQSFGVVMETIDVAIATRAFDGRTLAGLRAAGGDGPVLPPGVQVAGVTRGGHPLPVLPDLALRQGDTVSLYGRPDLLTVVGDRFGEPALKSDRTNLGYASFGIVLGVWVGLYSVRAAGVPFSLGTGGGALLSGLVFGWYQARHPSRLSLPPDAAGLLKDIGLATFIACVGLASGPQALTLIKQYGVTLPLMGVAIALIPALISLFVGHKLLKFEAPVLLGAIAGQQCSTPALSAVQNAAGNTTPLLGYTITYAISNVVLPLMGPLIVALAGWVAPH